MTYLRFRSQKLRRRAALTLVAIVGTILASTVYAQEQDDKVDRSATKAASDEGSNAAGRTEGESDSTDEPTDEPSSSVTEDKAPPREAEEAPKPPAHPASPQSALRPEQSNDPVTDTAHAAPAVSPTSRKLDAEPEGRAPMRSQQPALPSDTDQEKQPYSAMAKPGELRLSPDIVLLPHLQYRARFLAHSGKAFGGQEAFDVVTQRARVGIEGRVFSWIRMMIEVQDIRAWGEELSTVDFSAEGFDIYQGWGEVSFGGVSLRVGRQQLSFDGERIIGTLNWADQGRAFDGLRLYTRCGKWRGEAFWMYTADADVYAAITDADGTEIALRGAKKDNHLAGLWARYDMHPAIRSSVLALYDRTGTLSRDRVTLGLRVDGQPLKGVDYRGAAYFQTGRTGDGDARQTILAYLLTARVAYTLSVPWQPTLRAFFDYVSGDSDPNSGKVHAFDTLFGTNHKFYGIMDFFLNIPRDTAGFGLLDTGGRIQVTPCKGVKVWLDYHHFRFARRATFDGTRPRSLGNEIDLVANYVIHKYLKAQAGFGTFLPDEGITCLRGGCGNNDDAEFFGYLMATFLL